VREALNVMEVQNPEQKEYKNQAKYLLEYDDYFILDAVKRCRVQIGPGNIFISPHKKNEKRANV